MDKLRKILCCSVIWFVFYLFFFSVKVNAESVAKIGNGEYTSLSSAINAASTGTTIDVSSDINECVSINSNKNIIINLNGYNWTCSNGVVLTNSGTLTINGKEGKMYSSNNVVVLNNGSLIIDEVKEIYSSDTKTSAVITNNSVLIVKNSYVHATTAKSKYAIYNTNNGSTRLVASTVISEEAYNTININSGSLIVDKDSVIKNNSKTVLLDLAARPAGIYSDSSNKIEIIIDGKIGEVNTELDEREESCVRLFNKNINSKVTINDTAELITGGYAIYYEGIGNIDILGGKLSSTTGRVLYFVGDIVANVLKGEIDGNNFSNIIMKPSDKITSERGAPILTIGDKNAPIGDEPRLLNDNLSGISSNTVFNFYNGIIQTAIYEPHLAIEPNDVRDNSKVIKKNVIQNGQGNAQMEIMFYGSVKVANNYYGSVQEAIYNNGNNVTVELFDDVDMTNFIVFEKMEDARTYNINVENGKTVTINFNGFDLLGIGNITNNGTLKLNGEGSKITYRNYKTMDYFINNLGNVTIKNFDYIEGNIVNFSNLNIENVAKAVAQKNSNGFIKNSNGEVNVLNLNAEKDAGTANSWIVLSDDGIINISGDLTEITGNIFVNNGAELNVEKAVINGNIICNNVSSSFQVESVVVNIDSLTLNGSFSLKKGTGKVKKIQMNGGVSVTKSTLDFGEKGIVSTSEDIVIKNTSNHALSLNDEGIINFYNGVLMAKYAPVRIYEKTANINFNEGFSFAADISVVDEIRYNKAYLVNGKLVMTNEYGYDSLEDAFSVTQNELVAGLKFNTVELLKDVESCNVISKHTTYLRLNGYEITCNNGDAITTHLNSKLIIEGQGKIISKNGYALKNNGILVIDGNVKIISDTTYGVFNEEGATFEFVNGEIYGNKEVGAVSIDGNVVETEIVVIDGKEYSKFVDIFDNNIDNHNDKESIVNYIKNKKIIFIAAVVVLLLMFVFIVKHRRAKRLNNFKC